MKALFFLFVSFFLVACGNPVTIHSNSNENSLKVNSLNIREQNRAGDRRVCVGGMTGSNLLTFFANAEDSANPGSTLVVDPEQKDFFLVDISSALFLRSPESDSLEMALSGKSIVSNTVDDANAPGSLFFLQLDPILRQASVKMLTRLGKVNESFKAVLDRLGLSSRRFTVNRESNNFFAIEQKSFTEISIQGDRVILPFAAQPELLANPYATNDLVLFDSFDEKTGKLRKQVFWKNTKSAFSVPAKTDESNQFGGGLFHKALFWFEASETTLDFAILETDKRVRYFPLIMRSKVLPGAVRWMIERDRLRVFVASASSTTVDFQDFTFAEEQMKGSKITSIPRTALGLGPVLPSQLVFSTSEDFSQAFILDASQTSLGRVIGIDRATGKVSKRSRASCKEFVEYSQ